LVQLRRGEFIIKVGDFGMSEFLPSDSESMIKKDAQFAVRWSAPEVLTDHRISKNSDVWSYGVVLWEILELKQPYYEILNNQEVKELVCAQKLHLPTPTSVSSPLLNIIQRCTNYDPLLRPTFMDILLELDPKLEGVGELELYLMVDNVFKCVML